MDRKDFLKSVAAITGAATLSGVSVGARAAETEPSVSASGKKLTRKEAGALAEMTARRHAARWRMRRIICNNDGNDDICSSGETVSRALYLAKRTTGLVGTQVDTVSYCGGVTFADFSAKNPDRFVQQRKGKNRFASEFDAMGFDPLQVQLDFCRQHGIEFFWSHRMNDNHDTKTAALIPPFKKEHPEYLVGRDGPVKKMGKPMCYDYTLPEVRAKAVDFIVTMAQKYDLDGVELDFFRHPAYFRSQFMGQKVTPEETEMMTQVVRDIRAGLDKESLRRGRPYLLSVCIPDSIEFSKAIGIDWMKWAEEDLVDILIGADYLKFEPWKNFVGKARKCGLPCYARMEQRRLVLMMNQSSGEGAAPEAALNSSTTQLWCDEAYAAWLSGIDGIYTYNRFDPLSSIFTTIGDPRLLAKKGASPRESYGNASKGYNSPDYWVGGAKKFLKIPESQDYTIPYAFPNSDSKPMK